MKNRALFPCPLPHHPYPGKMAAWFQPPNWGKFACLGEKEGGKGEKGEKEGGKRRGGRGGRLVGVAVCLCWVPWGKSAGAGFCFIFTSKA